MTSIPETPDDQPVYLPPVVDDVLPNLPEGGQLNLLPVTALNADLRIDLPPWDDHAFGPQSLRLFWNGAMVAEKSWPAAVPDNEFFIMLPMTHLTEGVHELSYTVINRFGNPGDSAPLTLTIDTTPPRHPDRPAKLKFEPEVEFAGITRRYLEANDNKVVAEVPTYDYQPGDSILCYWEDGPWGEDVFLEEELTDDLQVTFDGDPLTALGNATYAVTYRLRDRAGNLSQLATNVQIKVDIAPPEQREFPWVQEAQPGNPGTLDPTNYSGGVRVRVPKDEDDPFEVSQLTVHWEGHDESGSTTDSTPDAEEATYWDFRIPATVFPSNFRREVTIYYGVQYPEGEPELSHTYTLKMGVITGTKVACVQSGGGKISLAAVPASGADVSVPPWSYKYLADNMRINLWMTGVAASGGNLLFDILTDEAVAMDRNPVTAKLPKGEIEKLKMNETFRLHASVSFDGGESWVTFDGLDLNLLP